MIGFEVVVSWRQPNVKWLPRSHSVRSWPFLLHWTSSGSPSPPTEYCAGS